MPDIKKHSYDTRKTSDLIPYRNNSRVHSEEQINQVASSIKEFGITAPVLIDEDNGILAGHCRTLAIKKLNIEETPVIVLSGLTEAQKKAYVLADNQLTLNADWDLDMLKLELETLEEMDFDLELLGFNDDFLKDLLFEEEDGLTDEDAVPEPPKDPVSKPGDLWILNGHRLLCGDSTLVDDVEAAINGVKVDMVFTDPPYNIDYRGWGQSREPIHNDKNSDEDFVSFLKDALYGCETMFVCCCCWQYAHLFKRAMTEINRKPKAMIVWDKVNPAQNIDRYYKQHELIFYYGDFGGQTTLRGDVWQLKRQGNPLHPTMKPIELIEMALSDNPQKQHVFDPFGGSGSTLIACEKQKRECTLIEIEPKYCDVIIERWQDFTGQQATHEADGLTYDEYKAQSIKNNK